MALSRAEGESMRRDKVAEFNLHIPDTKRDARFYGEDYYEELQIIGCGLSKLDDLFK